MKENSIEELKQRLEKLYRTQQARLDAGADDLDTREEIAEVEEEIKELQDDMNEQNNSDNYTNVGSIENSIEEDIKIIEKYLSHFKKVCSPEIQALHNILVGHKTALNLIEKLQEENEELKNAIAVANKLEERIKENFIAKKKLEDFMENELPDDETCKRWDIYDVNGVYIKEELEKLLESEETNDKNNKKG